MGDITSDATVGVQTLLVAANSFLTLLAGYFIKEFIKDVRKLTEDVWKMKRNIALLAQHVEYDIKNFSEE